jgi:hypothetical protein
VDPGGPAHRRKKLTDAVKALIRISVILAWLVMLPLVIASLAAFFVAAISRRWVIDIYIHDVYFVLPKPFVACSFAF